MAPQPTTLELHVHSENMDELTVEHKLEEKPEEMEMSEETPAEDDPEETPAEENPEETPAEENPEETPAEENPSPDDTPTGSDDNLAESGSDDAIDATDDSDDIDKMLNELQGFQEELEQESQNVFDEQKSPGAADLPSQLLDNFRFSLTAMEDTGEVDLDALLEDLCSMEKDLNANNSTSDNGSGFMEPPFTAKPNSPISPNAKVSADVRFRLESVQEETKELTLEEQQERIKAEKIRIALEKLRAARVKKLVVKVYNDEDPTSKTIAIDQTWTSWEVCKKMMRKNDAEPDPNWVLVERLPDLCIERLLEDHESVVDVVSNWPWENNNRLVIDNKREKYSLFRNPQNFLLSSDTSAGAAQLAEKSKDILLQEYFKEDAMRLPELDGILYLKEGKKSWKKHYFALRASGIYYTPKGKTKSSRDLVCLVKFEFVSAYTGSASFKKKFKAPTEHCFILKHPEYHDIESKAIKYFCAEDSKTFHRWIVCIRLAKYGYQMLEDYSTTQDEMDKLAFTLDKNRFPKAASFSVGQRSDDNMAAQITTARDNAAGKAKAQSDRIKQSVGSNYSGSQSFSVSRSQLDKRRPTKNIGNLFTDAWKKGTEAEEESDDPISPNSLSSGSGPGMTPNTLEPKSFYMDNTIAMDQIMEDPPPPPLPPHDLPLNLPQAATNTTRSNSDVERRNADNTADTDRIPSPSEIKSMLEAYHSPLAPPLPQKPKSRVSSSSEPVHVQSTSKHVAPAMHPAPASPPPPGMHPAPVPAPISYSSSQPPTSPVPFSVSPPRTTMSFSAAQHPPQPVALQSTVTSAEPPPPPPLVARKPSRSNSNGSQHSLEMVSPTRESPPETFDDSVDFPPPPSLPPPVKRKPSRSGSVNENRNGNRDENTQLDDIRGSIDSLDDLPPPPPPEAPDMSDVDLPPPPPEVIFKDRLDSFKARANSESNNRGRANSNEKYAPPPPPPKSGRPRQHSNVK